jgi:hypothetical protein
MRITLPDLLAAALITTGSAAATVTDVQLSLWGTMIGLAAVMATAQYQIMQGRIQAEQSASSTQALFAISAPQATMTLAASLLVETAWPRVFARVSAIVLQPNSVLQPDSADALRVHGHLRTFPLACNATAFDGMAVTSHSAMAQAVACETPALWPHDIWTHRYSAHETLYICITCICAVVLNYSAIALIGRLNPVSFQFLNQIKTVLIMAVGVFMFAEMATPIKMLGILTSCGGMIWYAYAKSR